MVVQLGVELELEIPRHAAPKPANAPPAKVANKAKTPANTANVNVKSRIMVGRGVIVKPNLLQAMPKTPPATPRKKVMPRSPHRSKISALHPALHPASEPALELALELEQTWTILVPAVLWYK